MLDSEAQAQISAFLSLGVLTATQELSSRTLSVFGEFDSEQVAEESLCVVTALSSHVVGLVGGSAALAPALSALRNLPYHYRDYVFGTIVLTRNEPLPDGYSDEIGARIAKYIRFYDQLLEMNALVLSDDGVHDKLLMWMGRISPAGRSDTPLQRLDHLRVTAPLVQHLELVRRFTTHCLARAQPAD